MRKLLSILILLALVFSVHSGPPIGQRVASPRLLGGSGTVLFLDETGLGSAAGAWSISRQLRSAYSGPLIRVRRSSDSTEQDINASAGVLDTSSLTTFCSGTDGFVAKVYDQSGNAHDQIQGTASSQPQIVSSGTIFTGANGKPECRFDGSNDRLAATSWSLVTPLTCFGVMRQISWVSGRYMLDGTTVNNMVLIQRTSTPRVSIFTPSTFIDNNDLVVGTTSMATLIFDGASSLVQINANAETTGTLPSGSPGGVVIGSSGSGTLFANMAFQEMTVYASDKNSTDRTTARGNINAFYALF